MIRAGHDAVSCDILDTETSGPHYKGDVRDIINDGWDMLIAFPPCTFLAVSGNKWFYHPDDRGPVESRRPPPRFPARRSAREEAAEFFMLLANADIPLIAIENPVGIMSSRWRKPDQIITPCSFGHREPKKTCLWLKGLPKLTATKVVEPDYMITKSGKRLGRWGFSPSPSPERKKMRSRTYQGVADAIADQWSAKEFEPALFE